LSGQVISAAGRRVEAKYTPRFPQENLRPGHVHGIMRGMRWRMGHVIGASAAAACVLAQCLAAAPASQKSAPRTPALEKAAVEKAVGDLKREYAAHLKNPAGAALRSVCDFFAKDSSQIPPDTLLAALEKPMPGDNRQAAYVKWQLLSGLPQPPDARCVGRLLGIYERAPLPAARYGCSAQEKRQLDAALAGARLQDDVRLTEKLEETVARGFAADQPIIEYRDELYRRLPPGRDEFVAALRDAHARVAVGAQKDKLAEALATDLQAWAIAGDDRPGQVREVAEMLGKLRFVESPPYYASAGARKGKLSWVEKTDTLMTSKKFAALHKTLLESAGASPAAAAAATTAPKKNGTK
jgi:hypothetical protein